MENNFTPIPVYPDPSPEKSNLKWPIFIATIFALILVGISIWFLVFKDKKIEGENLTQEISTTISPLETKDWKTYKNDNLGYEIKYPLDWTEEYSIITSSDKKAKFNVIRKVCSSYNSVGEFKYESYSTSTSGFIRNDCRYGMSIMLAIYGNDKELSEDGEKYEATLEQILSTMKLTVNTSDWKKYKNDQFLLEFKYPDGFRLDMMNDNYDLVDIHLEMFKPFPNEHDITQTADRWSPTNFFIMAQKTGYTTESLKKLEKNWEPIQFQGQDALLMVAGDFCDKKIVFINKGIRYEITDPSSCSVPLDNRIPGIFETFRVFDPDAELIFEIQNGKTYQNKQGGFEFKYPSYFTLREGPVIDKDLTPNMILVRFTPKNLASNLKDECKNQFGPNALECEIVNLSSLGISAYIYYDIDNYITHDVIKGKRILGSQRSYFDDYVSMKDKNGNKIIIDFLSTVSDQEEIGKIIKAVLSTLEFM